MADIATTYKGGDKFTPTQEKALGRYKRGGNDKVTPDNFKEAEEKTLYWESAESILTSNLLFC